jgi:hypothetical protein
MVFMALAVVTAVGCPKGKAHEPTPDLFRPSGVYQVGNSPTFLATADFNGDKVPDLVTANINGQNVSVLLGLGDGTFAERVRYRVGELPRMLVAADLTQDGASDLVVVNNGSNSLSILKNRGDGTFEDAVHRPVGQSPLATLTATAWSTWPCVCGSTISSFCWGTGWAVFETGRSSIPATRRRPWWRRTSIATTALIWPWRTAAT